MHPLNVRYQCRDLHSTVWTSPLDTIMNSLFMLTQCLSLCEAVATDITHMRGMVAGNVLLVLLHPKVCFRTMWAGSRLLMLQQHVLHKAVVALKISMKATGLLPFANFTGKFPFNPPPSPFWCTKLIGFIFLLVRSPLSWAFLFF